jgi:hypothetical protein
MNVNDWTLAEMERFEDVIGSAAGAVARGELNCVDVYRLDPRLKTEPPVEVRIRIEAARDEEARVPIAAQLNVREDETFDSWIARAQKLFASPGFIVNFVGKTVTGDNRI